MNDPFFRSYINQQPLRPARPLPVQQPQRKSSRKVVSVPVRFASSEQPQSTLSKESAALKIQTVFRGFLVRKGVKKIASIGNEVSEIESRVNDFGVVELFRGDAKERLRVNETLMSLLFKLDSIRGVDCGVRDFRKAVIKRAIVLQEKVDSIVATDYQTLDTANSDSSEIASEQVPESSDPRDEVVDDSVTKVDGENDVVKEIDENCNPVEAVDGCGVEESVETVPTGDLTKVEKENYSLEKVEGANVASKLVSKTMHEMRSESHKDQIKTMQSKVDRLEVDLSKSTSQPETFARAGKLRPQNAGGAVKVEDMINAFTKTEFVGNHMFRDLMVPKITRGEEEKRVVN